jgi:hypothetical protein
MRSFAEYLNKVSDDIKRKSYLYLHVTYPDFFDIPSLLFEYEIGGKCLFTYNCNNPRCNNTFISLFSDAKTICPQCKLPSAFLPSTHRAVDKLTLSHVINLFDVYVQYATNESLGLPAVEAASCGVPIVCVDYSAMSELNEKLSGDPIDVTHYLKEGETGRYLAVPSNEHLIELLIKYAYMPDSLRRTKGWRARQGAEQHFNWDDTAAKWEQLIDQTEIIPDEVSWLSPSRLFASHEISPAHLNTLNDYEFVKWCVTNILGRPDLLNSYFFSRLLRDLTWGGTSQSFSELYYNELSVAGEKVKRRDFQRSDLLGELLKLRKYWNDWERRRLQMFKIPY